MFGFTSPTVIGRQHPCCHRFAKSSRSADTDIALFRVQHRIGISEKSCFIHINLRLSCAFKAIKSSTPLPPTQKSTVNHILSLYRSNLVLAVCHIIFTAQPVFSQQRLGCVDCPDHVSA